VTFWIAKDGLEVLRTSVQVAPGVELRTTK